jgi:hypothetical protein
VCVPVDVLEGLEAVRQSGRTNMLEVSAVQLIAYQLGYHGTVLWIEDNEERYAVGIFHGFEAEG